MGAFARWINQSLRRRIAVVVSGLALLLGVAILTFSSYEVLRVSRTLYTERLTQLGGQVAPTLNRAPLDARVRLGHLASTPEVCHFAVSGGGVDAAGTANALAESVGSDPRVTEALTGSRGTPLAYSRRDSGQRWVGPPPGPDSLTGIGPYRVLDDSTTYYDIRLPIRENDRVVGFLVRRVRSTQTASGRATLEGLLGEGTSVVIGSPSTGAWNDLSRVTPTPPEVLLADDRVAMVTWDGRRYLAAGFPVPETPWRLVVRIAEPTVATPAAGYFRRAALLALLVVLIGVGVGVALGRTLSAPLQEITEVAEQIAGAEDPKFVPEQAPGEVGRLARAFNAMTERVASSTRRLRDNEASHRAFVSSATDGIWRIEFVPPASTTLSPPIQVESWYHLAPRAECNQALVRMTGHEPEGEVGHILLTELFPHDDPAVQRLLTEFVRNGYRISGAELVTSGPNESRRIFLNDLVGVVDSGGLRRIWGTRRDMTLSRMQDERLAKTDRLEAIGRLAGGIAHDFNNLLTAIVGYAESLQEEIPKGAPHHDDAVEINRIALRAAELTKQLLAFSRGQVMRPSLIDLNTVVRSSEGLLRRVLSEDFTLELALDEAIDAVEVDSGQLERVMMNLVVNARDAMPEGGTIEIRTAPGLPGEAHPRIRPDLRPGEYVTLSVSDTGTGMSDEVRQHLFEPFYTTKPKGKGTGLGLSTVYGIVRQSGGDITVASELGVGTTFTVYLPVKGRIAIPSTDGPVSAGGGGIVTLTGEESILVVEDEAPVREIVRRALAAAGYSVMVASEANEALALEAAGSAIDLVVTDMILPGQSGRELAREFRRRRPEIRVLVMSGYSGEHGEAPETLPEGAGYLAKPFSLVELRRRVREILDQPGPARMAGAPQSPSPVA